MNNKIFEDFKFNIGWKKNDVISLFGNEYPIILKVHAYYEEDGITSEQEDSYSDFCQKKNEFLNEAEQLMLSFDAIAKERFVPTMLLVERDGALALLCDDNEDLDEGIAVCLYPNKTIMFQSDFL